MQSRKEKLKVRFVIKFYYGDIVRHQETLNADSYIEAIAVAINRLGGWPTVDPFQITIEPALI